jgi:hypothetical protein
LECRCKLVARGAPWNVPPWARPELPDTKRKASMDLLVLLIIVLLILSVAGGAFISPLVFLLLLVVLLLFLGPYRGRRGRL